MNQITVAKSYYVLRLVFPLETKTLAPQVVYEANITRYMDPAILADEMKKINMAPYLLNDLLDTVVVEKFTNTHILDRFLLPPPHG